MLAVYMREVRLPTADISTLKTHKISPHAGIFLKKIFGYRLQRENITQAEP